MRQKRRTSEHSKSIVVTEDAPQTPDSCKVACSNQRRSFAMIYFLPIDRNLFHTRKNGSRLRTVIDIF